MAEIKSGASADLLTIDATSKAARATLYDASGNPMVLAEAAEPTTVAGAVMMGMNDRSALPFRVDRLGSQATALHTPLFTESFEGATLHALRWLATATTMAAVQATVTGLTINSGSITTINTGYMLQSTRRFLKSQRQPMQAKFRARMVHFNNSVMELGFGDASTFNGVHTAGAYWQRAASGVMQPVVTFNGLDQTGADIASSLSNANHYTFDVFMDDDEVVFVCQNTATGALISRQRIVLPLTGSRLWSATALPLMARAYNTGVAPSTAPQLLLTDTYVAGLDANLLMPFSDILAAQHRGFMDNPFTGAQLHTWTNSAEPASATLSNTAAGYATFGGKYQFVAPAGAVTDFALFGIQIPTPANLLLTGVDIEAWNLGAAVATTPTLLTWAIGAGATAVTLAGTLTRVGLGAQSFPVGAAIGAAAPRISKQFRTPIFVPAGRWLHVILRIPVGTATASQVIAGMVNLEGYFV